jgi:secreted Zn-dependent insulinase-like peptidase
MCARERQRYGCVQLPLQSKPVLAVKAVNPDEMNSAVQVYLQLGEYTCHLRALQLLCHQVLSEPLFNELRTEQQLGYSVNITTRTLQNSMNRTF